MNLTLRSLTPLIIVMSLLVGTPERLFAADSEGDLLGNGAGSDAADDLAYDDSEYDLLEDPWDPIEPVNRAVFWFNERIDRNLVEPIAKGYRKNVPQPIRAGVGNFFSNMRAPTEAASALIRFQFRDAVVHLGRFALNSTLGLGGIADPAGSLGLEAAEGDFAVAFAYHGVPPGPYLILPLMGPSTLRDTVGQVADMAADPTYWIGAGLTESESMVTDLSLLATRTVHVRSELIDAVQAGRDSSLDPYLFFQSAYYQYRASLLRPDKFDAEDSPFKK
jgi:phospholipid-binding lipoprotein MlaA